MDWPHDRPDIPTHHPGAGCPSRQPQPQVGLGRASGEGLAPSPGTSNGSAMRIAVLGPDAVGAPLAKVFAADGHAVKLANSRGPEKIRELAASLLASGSAVAARES